MSAPVFHRFDAYGPICGVRDGVNALDMDPPEITCRRCMKIPVEWWRGQKTEWKDGRLLLRTAA